MTPKEKANELINKYLSLDIEMNMSTKEAVRCSLIAVDEILMFDINAKSEAQFVIERRIEEYWAEVKNELLKL